jgi:nicotinate-nucleotide--dimethylbenzimidazole phosphoribosyltransferase
VVEGMALTAKTAKTAKMPNDLSRFEAALARVVRADPGWKAKADARLAGLTKPLNSLGRLEWLAARLSAIQRTVSPRAAPRRVVVFAADHGVSIEGVSAYPTSVTAQMVGNFLRGGAAINALAQSAGADVWVVDVGVAGPIDDGGSDALFLDRRVRCGTRNMVEGAAMTMGELQAALDVGMDVADKAASDGVLILGCGEMGIGNTTAASAITAWLAGVPAASVTGRGTGIDEQAYLRKVDVVARAIEVNREGRGPLDVLRAVGGFEIAAIVGAYVGAAGHRMAIVGDGFIATAAALIVSRLCPPFLDFWFAGHRSREPGHSVQLALLGQEPLLDLDLSLGEGTGAALAMPLFDAAVSAMNRMATFEAAGVSNRHGSAAASPAST